VGKAEAALRAFEAKLRSAGAPVADHLAEGLSEPTIRQELTRLAIAPSRDLIELYQWHDGTTHTAEDALGPDAALAPGVYFLSLDMAIAMTEMARDTATQVAETARDNGLAWSAADLWKPTWLGVFREVGSEVWAIASEERETSGVWVVRWQSAPERVAAGLDELVGEWVARIDSGEYFITGDGVFAERATT
jgi:hypothetical protein